MGGSEGRLSDLSPSQFSNGNARFLCSGEWFVQSDACPPEFRWKYLLASEAGCLDVRGDKGLPSSPAHKPIELASRGSQAKGIHGRKEA